MEAESDGHHRIMVTPITLRRRSPGQRYLVISATATTPKARAGAVAGWSRQCCPGLRHDDGGEPEGTGRLSRSNPERGHRHRNQPGSGGAPRPGKGSALAR
ncbi:hypothetical protein Are01nite_34240 [Actinoplanes regularis]|nr:hypothetical protein Are01nite_34240 [Actinoplanes regularis]